MSWILALVILFQTSTRSHFWPRETSSWQFFDPKKLVFGDPNHEGFKLTLPKSKKPPAPYRLPVIHQFFTRNFCC